jgi:hypothetical protein
MVFSYVMIAISEGLLVPKVKLVADFRDAGSIGRETEVQLAGKSIGKVESIEFVSQQYPCNWQTEDYGHPYQGRTDDCEPWMFCAPMGADPGEGSCAELEEFSGHSSDYVGCDNQAACGPGHVCVTQAFRQRYRGVRWWGQAGWCVAYDTESQRIRVTMEVEASSLRYVRRDSRASIVLNGILADPRVNISVGAGATVEDGARLQTTSSLMEDVLALKDQIDKITDDIDRGLIGVSALADSLSDEATKRDIQQLGENVREILRQVEYAEGLVGAVLNDPRVRADMSKTLREVRDQALAAAEDYAELERRVNRTMKQVDRAQGHIEELTEGLDDPTNTSLVAVLVNEDHGLRDDATRLADGTEEAIGFGKQAYADMLAALDEIGRAVEEREGSLGRLLADPKPLYHLKDPATLRRVNVVKRLVRWVIAEDEGPPTETGDQSRRR